MPDRDSNPERERQRGNDKATRERECGLHFLPRQKAGSDAAVGAGASAGAGAEAGVVCYPLPSLSVPGPLELLSGCRFIV